MITQLATPRSTPPLPATAVPLGIRPATLADLPFLDSLQKRYSKALGFFPRAQMEGYLKNGWVLIAERRDEETERRRDEVEGARDAVDAHYVSPSLRLSVSTPLGYIISRDRYLKRDELGVIYQLCVSDRVQRKFVGATLLREVFARSAYGCKLFCCWCAQDLEANYFWEAMGFVPIAFRAGSDKKRRVHIFWQKRIRQGDETTPWWFPAKTEGGAIREDRIVLPIPPGVRWSEVRGIDTETSGQGDKGKGEIESPLSPCLPVPLSSAHPVTPLVPPPRSPRHPGTPNRLIKGELPKRITLSSGGLRVFADAVPVKPKRARRETPCREQRRRGKADPKYVAAARELRDRWLEHVAENPGMIVGAGKYEIGRDFGRDGETKRRRDEVGGPARMLLPAA